MTQDGPAEETYNPWTVVNVVFNHLAEQGLHPAFGDTGDPGAAATALLRALGITPAAEGDNRTSQEVRDELAALRTTMFGEA